MICNDAEGDITPSIFSVCDPRQLRSLGENLHSGVDLINVLNALHMAEAINTKLQIIKGLEQRIINRERENNIRDYLAENPWLILQ